MPSKPGLDEPLNLLDGLCLEVRLGIPRRGAEPASVAETRQGHVGRTFDDAGRDLAAVVAEVAAGP